MLNHHLIVQKYGGTSVGTIERIKAVAVRVLDAHQTGDRVAVVVSAMSGETNRLVGLAHELNPLPYSPEYDLLIASGEQISVGLVTLAINTLARERKLIGANDSLARGLLASQLGIRTDNVYSKARIEAIDTRRLVEDFSKGHIPVIAGFQGVDSDNNITTLGRGGSDTSAVAVTAALKPHFKSVDCEIYTDVDGVYTTDPRICKEARKIPRISHEEMMELAGLGAKVLQIRSVELAANWDVPLHVRSSFSDALGTRVVSNAVLQSGDPMEKVVVAGVALDSKQVKFSLQNAPNVPGVAAKIFGALGSASVVVDVIALDVPSQGMLTISFTVAETDRLKSREVLEKLIHTLGGPQKVMLSEEDKLAKVSIVGVGMQNHPGVAARMFALLGEAGVNIRLISTSEIKISCMVDDARGPDAVRALHKGFELEQLD